MAMTINQGRIVVRDDIEPIHWAGEQGRFLLNAADTGGLFSFFEVLTPPGGGPPLHIHEAEDETFYVIEGEYEIRLDDQLHKAPAGTLVYGPRGVAHEFLNVHDGFSKMLCIATPGGVEDFFHGLSELFAHGGPPEWERMVQLADRSRIKGFKPGAGRRPGGPGKPGL
jgi:quercetin dioxygenase-like cupin family protein